MLFLLTLSKDFDIGMYSDIYEINLVQTRCDGTYYKACQHLMDLSAIVTPSYRGMQNN